MGGVFDFWKGQIPTKSPSKPGRGVVGIKIDRYITLTTIITEMSGMPPVSQVGCPLE